MLQLAPRLIAEEATRICTGCGEAKRISEFSLRRSGTRDYRPVCTGCWNRSQRERRRKNRKNKLKSAFLAIGRARRLYEVELLSKALIAHFGGLDCVSRGLAEGIKSMDKGCPSYCKFWTSVMQLSFWAKQAEEKREEEHDEAIVGLSYDEILEWDVEPEVVAMFDRGELVPILRRLVQQGKLKVEDLK